MKSTESSDKSSSENSAIFADREEWKFFFSHIGLSRKYIDQYTDLFCSHDIGTDMAPDFDHEVLKDIGVKKVGHRILILRNREKIFFVYFC